jgi:hypothetical protein
VKHQLSIIVVALALAGCAQTELEYQGVTPSFRTMSDTPSLNDYYVGGDLRFAITDRQPRDANGQPTTRELPAAKVDPDQLPKPLPPPPIP